MRAASKLTSGMVLLLSLLATTACRGRTTENMHPTGETVEVAIDTIGDAAPVAEDTLSGGNEKRNF